MSLLYIVFSGIIMIFVEICWIKLIDICTVLKDIHKELKDKHRDDETK